MSNKNKPVSRARESVRTDGKSTVQNAWQAWERGDRKPLLQIWDLYLNDRIPPELHHIMIRLIEHASIVTKRKPGRPRYSSRYHDDAKRAEIVGTVLWLRKIKPGMTLEHARQLTADRYNVSASQIKQYCLAQKPR